MSERRTIWGLRFFSLVVAVMAWAVISFGQREKVTLQVLPAQVSYTNTPANLIILEPVETVQVRMSGPDSRMANLNRQQVAVEVDLSRAVAGLQEVQLLPDAVTRPQGIDVVAIEPGLLTLELDEYVTDVRTVRARLAGEPAAGAVVTATRVTPPTVAVRGPQTVLSRIEELTTRPIRLEGHAIDFQERTLIEVPGQLVEVLTALVTVEITLEVPSAASALEESPAL